MAHLSEQTINTVFTLQRRLLQLGNEATAVSFIILEQFGETETTMIALVQLDNVRERALSYYTRLYRLMWQVVESQPVATSATMNLLAQSIEQTQSVADAGDATVQEAKRDFNLL